MTSILVVPGYTGSGPEHWQSVWERADARLRRVEQRDWERPILAEWVEALDAGVASSAGPVVLVAHSLGCITVAHWASRSAHRLGGALLVAPADVERSDAPSPIRGFAPVPLHRLPFPSIVVASGNDPYVAMERAEAFACAWGSRLVDVGHAGHIDTAAGFGEWPQGRVLLEKLCAGCSS